MFLVNQKGVQVKTADTFQDHPKHHKGDIPSIMLGPPQASHQGHPNHHTGSVPTTTPGPSQESHWGHPDHHTGAIPTITWGPSQPSHRRHPNHHTGATPNHHTGAVPTIASVTGPALPPMLSSPPLHFQLKYFSPSDQPQLQHSLSSILCFMIFTWPHSSGTPSHFPFSSKEEGRRSDAACKPSFHLSCFVPLYFSTPGKLHCITSF